MIIGALICGSYTFVEYKNIMTFLLSISFLAEDQISETDPKLTTKQIINPIRNPVTTYLVKCSSTFFKKTAETLNLSHILEKMRFRGDKKNVENQKLSPMTQSLFAKRKPCLENGKISLNTLNASQDIKSASMYDFKENSLHKQSSSQKQLCLICINNIANAVLMDCGHGGVCMQCALDLWKKKCECYLCRQKIQFVYEVEVKNKETEGVVKVIAEVKVETDQNKEFSSFSNDEEEFTESLEQ